MAPIKIFGLQRSGTNWLTSLLRRNFRDVDVWVNKGGWKHGYWRPSNAKANILVVSKSPYAWLHSVYRYWGPERKLNIGPDLRDVSFRDFLGSRLVLEQQRDVPFLYRAANPIQHWNNMHLHWLSIRGENVVQVQYEALLANIHKPLLQIMDRFNLDPISKDLKFENTMQTCLPSGEDTRLSSTNFDASHYHQAKFMEAYDSELLAFVNQNLDPDVMKMLGYATLEATC